MIDRRKTMISAKGQPRSFRDSGTRRKEVEAKYGRGAQLSPNQRLAHANLGDRSQIDSFIPVDVANIAGVPVSQVARAWFGPPATEAESPELSGLSYPGWRAAY